MMNTVASKGRGEAKQLKAVEEQVMVTLEKHF